MAKKDRWVVVRIDRNVFPRKGVSLPVVAKSVPEVLAALIDSNGAPHFDVIEPFVLKNAYD